MSMKRGFVTVATGSYYCRLAKNMIMSYRLFSSGKYPFYVITDEKGVDRLKKYFDGVIVMKDPSYTFMDKIAVYENSPFEETVFLDADINIVNDISGMFDAFEQNGSPVSCLGRMIPISDTARPIHFGDVAVEHFHLTEYIAFNGGVYYFKKSEKATAFIRFILDELVPNYERYELKVFRTGQMADEPLIGLAMLVQNMKPALIEKHHLGLVQDMKTLSWDMKSRSATHNRYGEVISTIILHYGTHNTYHKKYVYYNAIVKGKYRKAPVLTPFYMIGGETRLLFAHLRNPQDRRKIKKWFCAHFSRQHFRHRLDQVKSLFKRS